MLKMQLTLPLKKAEEGDETAEDEKEPSRADFFSESAADRLRETTTEDGAFPFLTKEAVYEWFGLHLKPAKRIEFMYGLLHMCQPLELRFLGSCLEDLARKDFHVLRDFEIRANSPADLALLTDVIDPVTRSKLLVCLSLLGSDNRECAGVLFRILSHVDPALLAASYPDPPRFAPVPVRVRAPSPSGAHPDNGTPAASGSDPLIESRCGFLEQLAVLFTMASLHPAFLFHQRDKLRTQLEKAERAFVEEQSKRCYGQTNAATRPRKPECVFASRDVCVGERAQSHHLTPAHHNRRAEKDAVHIERIVLKRISWGKTDREYSFEVKWSDLSTSSVTKTHLELENFLLKLPKDQSTDSFEKGILRLLNQGQKHEGKEVEQSLKEKFLSAPHTFRQTSKVCVFFHCGFPSSSSLPCSRCNHISSGKPYKDYFSEVSSQEEGDLSVYSGVCVKLSQLDQAKTSLLDMETYVQGHRKKPGNRSPSISTWSGEGRRAEHLSEDNSLTERRKKSSLQNTRPTVEERESSSSKPKSKAAPPVSEKGQRGVGRVLHINGVVSPSSLAHHTKGKAACLDRGSHQTTYGETSSESYSSPSSPQHDGRESLESEDEKGKGKDTDSQSDDSRKSVADSVLVCPMAVGAVDALHPLIPLEQAVQATGMELPQIHFGSYAPYTEVLTTGPSPQLPDTKVGAELLMPHPINPSPSASLEDSEKCPSGIPPSVPPFGISVLGLQSPGSPVLQSVLPRPGVVQSSAAYQPALQAAYTGAEPVFGNIATTETHSKPTGLSLPSALPPTFSLPIATTGMPPLGTASATSQVAAPVVPTHTPGPAPSPIPALTHSTAQSDGSSYINSSATNSIPQQLPANQQAALGCNACGCRGNCGTGHAHNYYFPTQMTQRQVFGMPPIFQLTSLCGSSYLNQLNQAQQNNGAQMPFFPAAPGAFTGGTLLHPPGHVHSPDHLLGSQAASFGLQQMPAFSRFYHPVYPTVVPAAAAGGGPGMAIGAVSGGINKKNGTISCYNCGGGGHFAQDCKQPPVDASQQGGFRLKYAPHSESLDNNPD